MPHWLALALPALSLQLTQRRFDPALAQSLALAIIDGPAQRARVVFCNDKARTAGVFPGMQLAAAQALARELIAVERDPERERGALQELACWAYQFSPHIVAYERADCSGLLMETGASERLFGGRQSLHRRIAVGLRQLGYHACSASAATPAAARILAASRVAGLGANDAGVQGVVDYSAESAADCADPALLARAIGKLPYRLLGWAETITSRLQALGLATIGDILALPRDAFARRFGTAALLDLDRVLGRIADPQAPFHPPEQFTARIELPADIEDVGRLLQPLQGLLLLLEGFLRGQNAGATALLLSAFHSPRRAQSAAPTRIPLTLAAPERNPQRLLQLYSERLARVRLQAPAVLLELQLERMAGFVSVSGSFLPPSPQASAPCADTLQLTELLHARLGSEGVFQLQALSDHRPEYAYRVTPLSPEPLRAPAPSPAPAQRPMLILPEPRPLAQPAHEHLLPSYRGPLALLAGPERIEAGWWDMGRPQRATVHRDYYVARNPQGQTLWVYRELAAPHRWFLHGFFA
jgi:protein ImuB